MLDCVMRYSPTASITEFVNEIEGYNADGATEEELAFTKSSLGQSDARAFETPRQKLGFLSRMATYGLKVDHVDEQADILANMTNADFDTLAKAHLDLSEMIMVVVGDKPLAAIAAVTTLTVGINRTNPTHRRSPEIVAGVSACLHT